MKAKNLIYVLLLSLLIITGACSSTAWDEMPRPVADFTARYFPGQAVKSYDETGNGCRVTIRNGASIDFDKNYLWTVIDGNGNRLPQMLIYDQMPPALFQYLSETHADRDVYKVERTADTYIVTLADTYLTYDVSTARVTLP